MRGRIAASAPAWTDRASGLELERGAQVLRVEPHDFRRPDAQPGVRLVLAAPLQPDFPGPQRQAADRRAGPAADVEGELLPIAVRGFAGHGERDGPRRPEPVRGPLEAHQQSAGLADDEARVRLACIVQRRSLALRTADVKSDFFRGQPFEAVATAAQELA